MSLCFVSVIPYKEFALYFYSKGKVHIQSNWVHIGCYKHPIWDLANKLNPKFRNSGYPEKGCIWEPQFRKISESQNFRKTNPIDLKAATETFPSIA